MSSRSPADIREGIESNIERLKGSSCIRRAKLSDKHLSAYINTKGDNKDIFKRIRKVCKKLTIQDNDSGSGSASTLVPVDLTPMIEMECRRVGFSTIINGELIIDACRYPEVLIYENPYLEEAIQGYSPGGEGDKGRLTKKNEIFVVLSTPTSAPFMSVVSDFAAFAVHKGITNTSVLLYFWGNYMHIPKPQISEKDFLETAVSRWVQDIVAEETASKKDVDDGVSPKLDECPICFEEGIPVIMCTQCMSAACVLCFRAAQGKCHVCGTIASSVNDKQQDHERTAAVAKEIFEDVRSF